MPGLLKGGTGEVGQVGSPLRGDTVKVTVLHLLAGHQGPFGEDSPQPWHQPNAGEGKEEQE